MQPRRITFIGAGKMAHAIIAGLITADYPSHCITVCSPTTNNRDLLVKTYGIHGAKDNCEESKHADVIVLAVKPQFIAAICKTLKKKITFNNKLILTISTRITVRQYQQYLTPNIHLIRVMPNILSLVSHSVSGLYAMDSVSDHDKNFVTELMNKIGKAFWLPNESAINDILSISGSSPAYFFLFMELIQQEAERLGFNNQIAKELVLYTAQGSVLP